MKSSDEVMKTVSKAPKKKVDARKGPNIQRAPRRIIAVATRHVGGAVQQRFYIARMAMELYAMNTGIVPSYGKNIMAMEIGYDAGDVPNVMRIIDRIGEVCSSAQGAVEKAHAIHEEYLKEGGKNGTIGYGFMIKIMENYRIEYDILEW